MLYFWLDLSNLILHKSIKYECKRKYFHKNNFNLKKPQMPHNKLCKTLFSFKLLCNYFKAFSSSLKTSNLEIIHNALQVILWKNNI